jgi:hypothetical protein
VEDNPPEIYLLKKGFETGPLPVSLHSVTSLRGCLRSS